MIFRSPGHSVRPKKSIKMYKFNVNNKEIYF